MGKFFPRRKILHCAEQNKTIESFHSLKPSTAPFSFACLASETLFDIDFS